MQETQVRSLGREVPLEKEMAAHSSILAWIVPWPEEPGRLQSIGFQRVGCYSVYTHPDAVGNAQILVGVGQQDMTVKT